MTHCIIMTAYHDLPMINRFISKIPHDWGIYIHLDVKSKIRVSDINPRAKVYKNKKIYWGAWEHLWAFIFLLQESHKENRFDYYHLVTGQDYFASNPSAFDVILGKNQDSYVGVFPIPNEKWGWEGGEKIFKYRTISSFADVRNHIPKLINKVLYILQRVLKITKRLPQMELYGGSVYSSLHVDFVEWLLNDKCSKELFEYLRNTTCAEEVYIPTVIMNSPYKSKCVNLNLRYDDWSVDPAPKYLTDIDFRRVIDSGTLFCRKVDSSKSSSLIDRLDFYFDDTECIL